MVPVYAGLTWVAIAFPDQKLWLVCLRECYSSVALHSLSRLLLTYIGGERRLAISLELKEAIPHPWPFRLVFPPLTPSASLLRLVQQCVDQFIFVRPLTAVITLVATGAAVHHEWYFGLNDSFVYLFLVANTSAGISAPHSCVCLNGTLRCTAPLCWSRR